MSPFEKIDIESQLTGYSSAGCITYVELDGGVKNNLSALETIKNTGRKLCFLTNNSSRSVDEYVEKLARMGIKVADDEIYTSGMATVRYLKENHKDKTVYLMGTDRLRQEFEQNGITLVEKNADVVVIGYDTELTYKKLTLLTDNINGGAFYVCTHSDINCPSEPYYLPDVGSFIELIKKSTGKSPDVICGKPFEPMGRAVAAKFGLNANEIAMVGDRLSTDIAFGNVNGFTSVLVLSGETTREMHEASDIKADVVLGSIKELTGLL